MRTARDSLIQPVPAAYLVRDIERACQTWSVSIEEEEKVEEESLILTGVHYREGEVRVIRDH